MAIPSIIDPVPIAMAEMVPLIKKRAANEKKAPKATGNNNKTSKRKFLK